VIESYLKYTDVEHNQSLRLTPTLTEGYHALERCRAKLIQRLTTLGIEQPEMNVIIASSLEVLEIWLSNKDGRY
jgi:hypothetical protein